MTPARIVARAGRRRSSRILPTMLLFLLLTSLVDADSAHSSPHRHRRLFSNFHEYIPTNIVSDEAAIAYDQAELMRLLDRGMVDTTERTYAWHMYTSGGFSESFAEITLKEPLPFDIPLHTVVMGKNYDEEDIACRTMAQYTAGDTLLHLQYPIDNDLADDKYMTCQVGGRPDPKYDECLVGHGEIRVQDGTHDDVSMKYHYQSTTDNKNGRTLQYLAGTMGMRKNKPCSGCDWYHDFERFQDHYGQSDFVDLITRAAYDGTSVTNFHEKADHYDFALQIPEFKEQHVVLRNAAIHASTAYLTFFIHTIREMENSLRVCQQDCPNQGLGDTTPASELCNHKSLHALDVAVAFYAGAHVNDDNGGNLLYGLAQEECHHFNTCLHHDRFSAKTTLSSLEGDEAYVNHEIITLFQKMQTNFLEAQCTDARKYKDEIVHLMWVPFVQGTLRAAYKLNGQRLSATSDPGDYDFATRGSSTVYAATLAPHIDACHERNAEILTTHMNPLVGFTKTDFAKVKQVLEESYDCFGITCAEIGGLVDPNAKGKRGANPTYLEGAEPCQDHSTFLSEESTKGKGPGLVVGFVVFAVVACFGAYWWYRRSRRLGRRGRNRRGKRGQQKRRSRYRDTKVTRGPKDTIVFNSSYDSDSSDSSDSSDEGVEGTWT